MAGFPASHVSFPRGKLDISPRPWRVSCCGWWFPVCCSEPRKKPAPTWVRCAFLGKSLESSLIPWTPLEALGWLVFKPLAGHPKFCQKIHTLERIMSICVLWYCVCKCMLSIIYFKALSVLTCVRRLKPFSWRLMKCLSERDVLHSIHLCVFDYVIYCVYVTICLGFLFMCSAQILS